MTRLPFLYKKLEEKLDGKLEYDISELRRKLKNSLFNLSNSDIVEILRDMEKFEILRQKDLRKFEMTKNVRLLTVMVMFFYFASTASMLNLVKFVVLASL